MPGDDLGPPDPAAFPAAERWGRQLAAASIAAVPVPPLGDAAGGRSIRWAREVLPPVGGTVLDIGCGAGAAAIALVPPASEIIGVDPIGALLDEFVANAVERGVARRTVHGAWPDVVATTPVADVAICQHVAHSIEDIAPFVLTLTDRARLAVVVELVVEHPTPPMRAVAAALGAEVDPASIRAVDLVPVLGELGLAPETTVHSRPIAAGDELAGLAAAAARWLGIGDERLDEVARAIADHAAGTAVEVMTLRWPGAADPT